MYRKFPFILLFLNILEAESNSWDEVRERGLGEGEEYNISSGTGFYINNHYILTNEHVVQDCLNISVRGAVEPAPAYLYAKDVNLDLALIRTETEPKNIAKISANPINLSVGDEISIVGYPLESADTGEYKYNRAIIESIEKKDSDIIRVEFSFAVEHGNSGGPIIDLSGNIIGMVQARKSYYLNTGQTLSLVNSLGIDEKKPFKTSGIGIGITNLKKFLDNNNIIYNSNFSYKNLKNYNNQEVAKDYIVNIHCVKK